MEIRRSVGRLGCIILSLMLVYALLNFLFDFRIFEVVVLPSCFPYPERMKLTQGVLAVITPIGMVCFALSYISSVSASRVKGILMEDVISNSYPHYKWVFTLHGCFAVFGLYSTAAESPPAPRAAVVCLAGVLFCLLYALVMAYRTCFNQASCNKLVAQYVTDLQRKPDSERSIQTVYQVGRYISEWYRDNGLHFECLSGQEEKNLISAITGLLVSGNNEQQNMSPQKSPDDLPWRIEPSYALSQKFYQVFRLDCGNQPDPEHILYSLPAYERRCRVCQDNIHRCSALWGIMLSQLRDDTQRAAFAGDFIRVSPHSSLLCCGLVHCLRSSRIRYAGDEEGWKDCSRLIGHMIKNAEYISDEQVREKAVLCCRDITFLCFSLALWEEACSPAVGLANSFAVPLFSMIDPSSRKGLFIYRDDCHIAKYLSFAYMILQLLACPDVILPSRADLHHLIPVIIQKFREPLTVSGK